MRVGFYLTLSWRRPLSYRNQSIDLKSKSMDWLLYDNVLRHERVNMRKMWKWNKSPKQKCLNTEFFLKRIFLYSDWIQENRDQKKLRIWNSVFKKKLFSRSDFFLSLRSTLISNWQKNIFSYRHIFCWLSLSKNLIFWDVNGQWIVFILSLTYTTFMFQNGHTRIKSGWYMAHSQKQPIRFVIKTLFSSFGNLIDKNLWRSSFSWSLI